MKRILVIAIVALAAFGGLEVQAQGGENCPEMVTAALESLDMVCTGLGRNAACYGYNRVDATFWQPRADLAFSQPADRVALLELQTIATAPLDVEADRWGVVLLNLQADLPETLPGQAVTMLVMGDTTLTNRVTPEQAAGTIVPVAGQTMTAANVRSRPTTSANIVTSFPAGQTLTITALNEGRDWYELLLDDGSRGWIWNNLVRVTDRAALDVLPVGERARYGPMQAFYFTTGFGAPECNQAPNALIVQSTELAEVTLSVNELEIQLGSTVVITTAPTNDGAGRVLVLTLIEGRLEARIDGTRVVLTRPGTAVAFTLNAMGLVDRTSRLVRLNDVAIGAQVAGACQFAAMSGLFGTLTVPDCPAAVTYYIPPPPPTAVPTPAGPAINFWADRTVINPGECASLGWDVSNVREVYYQGQGVTGQGSRQECPRQNTTYALTIVTTSGEQQTRTITITVVGSYSIAFWADRTSMSYTDCATFFWTTDGVREVYYNGRGVVGNGSQQECPRVPGTLIRELRVVLQNGQAEVRTVAVDVK